MGRDAQKREAVLIKEYDPWTINSDPASQLDKDRKESESRKINCGNFCAEKRFEAAIAGLQQERPAQCGVYSSLQDGELCSSLTGLGRG